MRRLIPVLAALATAAAAFAQTPPPRTADDIASARDPHQNIKALIRGAADASIVADRASEQLADRPASAASAGDKSLAEDAARLVNKTRKLSESIDRLASAAGAVPPTRLSVFHGYIGVFAVAFLVTIIATPFMRKLAIRHGVIDRPSVSRKIHKMPVAYLGGVAVYLGIMAGVLFAITQPFHQLVDFHVSASGAMDVPFNAVVSVLLGMSVIMVCGLIDDVVGIDPRAKIAGMLFAAAALATQDVGTQVAAGFIRPVADVLHIPTVTLNGVSTVGFTIPLPGGGIPVDVIYWIGTAIIALFVLGACNASNLLDGLDGLLTGTTSIAAIGLLLVALAMAVNDDGGAGAGGPGHNLDALRIVLCLALLGACLGFLPHNFNPATIFLGDAGSLMLGFVTIVVVLTLGNTGKTHFVLAGLIIYGLPIMDTTLAIVRRKISGKKVSDADDQHLHHMLRRALGVKGAVFVLYGIGVAFAALGVALSEERGRVTYAITIVFAAFIGVTAFKVARRAHFEEQAHAMAASGRGKVERGGQTHRPAPPEPGAPTMVPAAGAAPLAEGAPAPAPGAPRAEDPLIRR